MFWFDRLTFETRADGSKWRADTGEAEETLQGDATWAGEGSVEEEEEDGDGAAPWEHGGLIAAVTPKLHDDNDVWLPIVPAFPRCIMPAWREVRESLDQRSA